MHTNTVLIILIIIVALLITGPQYHILIATAGALGIALMVYTRDEPENFESDVVVPEQYTPPVETFDNSDAVSRLFSEPRAVDGDQQLYEQMKNVSGRDKQAAMNRARFTSENFKQLFQEELDEQEKRDWWEDDGLEHQMVKDGVDYY